MEYKSDKSFIKEIALGKKIPIADLILNTLNQISKKYHENITLFGVCPNSISVVKSALRSAKRFNAPLMFVATLNQVDLDSGYTGWTQRDFVEVVREEARKIDFKGPIIITLDHGGPWLKDKQAMENWSLDDAMDGVKKSRLASLEAGYDLLHIDPTVDRTLPKGETIAIKTVVERTLDLIECVEVIRRERNLPRISYEVGTEEVHGGLSDLNAFRKLLKGLKSELSKRGLDVYPCFIVGKVGTDIHTTEFDSATAKTLVNIAREYGSCIKGHYTDYVSNPQDYPKVGMGGANVGPEFSHAEFDSLERLTKIEEGLVEGGKAITPSDFMHILTESVINSNRWKKWLLDSETGEDFSELSGDRQKWLLQTCSRYVWTQKAVVEARSKLYKNLKNQDMGGEEMVLRRIDKVMEKYITSFNLVGSTTKIEQMLKEGFT
ncbi:D-tagatose-1,6-bisphosphate aldolase subunit KbaZ [subsurface metagenome]